jgi:lysozyme
VEKVEEAKAPVVTPKIRKMFHVDEGLSFKLYKCTAGKITVGYGRNIQDNGISQRVADLMLEEDVIEAEKICIRVFGKVLWEKWSENRRLGWINFAFNLGQTRLLQFRNTLRAALREDWVGVEAGLRASAWFQQVKTRAPRVIGMICREEFPYG